MIPLTRLPEINTFGVYGQKIITQMENDLRESEYKLELTYDPKTQKFTVLNSKDVSVYQIETIFA